MEKLIERLIYIERLEEGYSKDLMLSELIDELESERNNKAREKNELH